MIKVGVDKIQIVLQVWLILSTNLGHSLECPGMWFPRRDQRHVASADNADGDSFHGSSPSRRDEQLRANELVYWEVTLMERRRRGYRLGG